MNTTTSSKLFEKIPILKGKSNYVDWAEVSLMALESNGLDCVLKSEKVAADQKATREQSDRAVRATLLLSCCDEVRQTLKQKATAKEVWDLAKTRYGTPSKLRTAEILSEFYGVRLDDKTSVEDFVNRKRHLRQLAKNADKAIGDDDFIAAVMVGVRGQYEALVESLEASISTLTSEDLETRLLNAEESRKHKKIPDARAASASKITCSHCKKVGHLVDRCWDLHPEKKPKYFKRREETKHAEESAKSATIDNTEEPSDSGYTWFADSGCTQHMTGSKTFLGNYRADQTKIVTADNNIISAKGKGNLKVKFKLPSGKVIKSEFEALHVPELGPTNLFSVQSAVKGSKKMVFNEFNCELRNRYDVLEAIGEAETNGMYRLEMTPQKPHFRETAAAAIRLQLAHQRINHRNYKDLKLLPSITQGLTISDPKRDPEFCEPCTIGKAKRKPFPKLRKPRIKALCELVWFDTCGKLKGMTGDGKQYFITFTEDTSRYRKTYLLTRKSEAFDKFKVYRAQLENRTGRRVKIVHADNAREFLSGKFRKYLERRGIVMQTNVEYSSEQNLAERGHGIIMDAARSMIQQAMLPRSFLGLAILTATHVLNCMPSPYRQG
jgi:hypothetical protein